MIPFKVLWLEYNKNKPTYYDIMPYLVRKYNDAYKADKPSKKNFEQCKDFVTRKLMYQYWARCEYEFIIAHWPYKEDSPLKDSYKIDIFEQCKMNIDIITRVFMKNIQKL